MVPRTVWQAFEEPNLTPEHCVNRTPSDPRCSRASFELPVKVVSVTHVMMIADCTSLSGKSPLPSRKGSGGMLIIQMNTCNIEGRHTFCIDDQLVSLSLWLKHLLSFHFYWLCFQASCSVYVCMYVCQHILQIIRMKDDPNSFDLKKKK